MQMCVCYIFNIFIFLLIKRVFSEHLWKQSFLKFRFLFLRPFWLLKPFCHWLHSSIPTAKEVIHRNISALRYIEVLIGIVEPYYVTRLSRKGCGIALGCDVWGGGQVSVTCMLNDNVLLNMIGAILLFISYLYGLCLIQHLSPKGYFVYVGFILICYFLSCNSYFIESWKCSLNTVMLQLQFN